MTRTGKSPRLSAHAPEPALSVHPADARRLGLSDEGLVRIQGQDGRAMARVRITDAQRKGEVFLPMHWNDRFTADCVVGALVIGVTDPHSGQPDSKRSPVRITPMNPDWTGLLITARPVEPRFEGYWSRQAAEGCTVFSMAGEDAVPDINALDPMFPELAGCQHVEYVDTARGVVRRAWFDGDQLAACVFIAQGGSLPDRTWLVRLVGGGRVDAPTRLAMLSGRPPADAPNDGHTVCACFGVGVNRIAAAIRERDLVSVEEIGAALQAGTNCGSCIPELKGILNDARQRHAVA